jgi:hypothetical protein
MDILLRARACRGEHFAQRTEARLARALHARLVDSVVHVLPVHFQLVGLVRSAVRLCHECFSSSAPRPFCEVQGVRTIKATYKDGLLYSHAVFREDMHFVCSKTTRQAAIQGKYLCTFVCTRACLRVLCFRARLHECMLACCMRIKSCMEDVPRKTRVPLLVWSISWRAPPR